MVDTPPDLRHQLEREQVRSVDHVLWTHCHYDHLGGLGELEYMVRLGKNATLPCLASPAAKTGILAEFHYMDDILDFRTLEAFEAVEIDDVRYTTLPVTHATGTYGYLMETATTKLFYASDTGRLPAATADRVRGCDILIMDATFWGRNWSPQAHHEHPGNHRGRLRAGSGHRVPYPSGYALRHPRHPCAAGRLSAALPGEGTGCPGRHDVGILIIGNSKILQVSTI